MCLTKSDKQGHNKLKKVHRIWRTQAKENQYLRDICIEGKQSKKTTRYWRAFKSLPTLPNNFPYTFRMNPLWSFLPLYIQLPLSHLIINSTNSPLYQQNIPPLHVHWLIPPLPLFIAPNISQHWFSGLWCWGVTMGLWSLNAYTRYEACREGAIIKTVTNYFLIIIALLLELSNYLAITILFMTLHMNEYIFCFDA